MSAFAKLLRHGRDDAAEVARFTGYFCGLELLEVEDECAYLAAADGCVFAEHQDEWSLKLDKARTHARGGPLKPTLDPKPLKRRVEWLVEVFLDISRDSARALKSAAPYVQWEKERSAVAKEPHVAAYWILSHWLIGNADALADAIAVSAKSGDAIVQELRKAFVAGVDGKAALKGVPAVRLVKERVRVRATAPRSLFAPAAQRARATRDKTNDAIRVDESAAYHALVNSKDARAAVQLFEELKSKAGQDYFSIVPPGGLWPTIRKFAEHVDGRWLPVLRAAYDRQATRPDVHKKVIPGIVLGLAAACANLDEFFAQAPTASTAAFKGDRKLEYALGVAHFAADQRAVDWLVKRAEDRVRRVNEWDVEGNAAYDALITTQTPEARSAVKRVLDAKEVDGRNWQFLKEAAVAAGRIGAKEAAGGVKKMLARLDDDDGWKPHLKKALAALAR